MSLKNIFLYILIWKIHTDTIQLSSSSVCPIRIYSAGSVDSLLQVEPSCHCCLDAKYTTSKHGAVVSIFQTYFCLCIWHFLCSGMKNNCFLKKNAAIWHKPAVSFLSPISSSCLSISKCLEKSAVGFFPSGLYERLRLHFHTGTRLH